MLDQLRTELCDNLVMRYQVIADFTALAHLARAIVLHTIGGKFESYRRYQSNLNLAVAKVRKLAIERTGTLRACKVTERRTICAV